MKKLFFFTYFLLLFQVAKPQSIYLSLEKFGAKADGTILQDGSMDAGSPALTCTSASFTQKDIGKIVYVAGAANNTNTLIATIRSISSPTQIILSKPALISVNNAGVTYGTDCTDAFVNWNKAARVNRKNKIILLMKPGTYLTSYNIWLAGVKDVLVNGNGCNIICTHGAYKPYSAGAAVGLFMPSCFDNVDNNYYDDKQLGNTSFGYKIQTCKKGSTMLQTSNVPDATNFKPDTWLLVYGLHHEDFGGYPPDPRFFEYAKVKTVDAITGFIHLDRPLKNLYDSEWPDGKQRGGVGAARIISLNRDNFNCIENLIIKNIHFLPFNGWNGKFSNDQRNSRIQIYGYINALLSNVTTSAAYFGQGKKLIVNHVTVTSGCEPDKVIDSCIIKNCTIANLINAGGLNYLHLLNNTFTGGFNASPHNLYVNGNTFKSKGVSSQSLAAFGFNKGTDYIQIGVNTWDCSDPLRNALVSPPLIVTMTVGQVLNSSTITIPYDSYIVAHNSRRVVPGTTGYTTSGKQFDVQRVYQFDENNIAISGVFSKGQPAVKDAYIFSMAPIINVTGKQIKTGSNANKYIFFQKLLPITRLKMSNESFKN